MSAMGQYGHSPHSINSSASEVNSVKLSVGCSARNSPTRQSTVSTTMEMAMITGMHAVVYTRNAEADRAFFRDVLGFSFVDAGGGWLFFAAPPSELACHPAESNGKHELYLMCDDLRAAIAHLGEQGIACGPVSDQGWGLLSTVRLPGGGDLGLYEPHHPTAYRQSH